MKKIAIIGFGRAGKIHFFNILKNSNLTLKVIIDVKSKHQEIKDFLTNNNFNSKFISVMTEKQFSSSRTNFNLDMICVTSPTKLHYQHINLGLQKNLHVFCEKPISYNETEIKECFDYAKKKNKILLCAFNRIFDPYIQSVKNKIDRIGNIHKIITISRDFPYPTSDYIKISGGIFHDCASHDIHYICWLLNKYPKEVMVIGQNIKNIEGNKFNLDDAIINLKFDSNIISTIHLSRISTNYDQRIEVYGDKGDVKMVNPYIDPVTSDNKIDNEFPVSFQNRYAISYKNIMNYFYNLISNNDTKCLITKDNCINITKIIKACETSFLEKKIVTINYN